MSKREKAPPHSKSLPVIASKTGPSGRRKLERILGIVALALLVVARIVGAVRAKADLMPAIQQAMPDADHFEPRNNGTYVAWADDAENKLLGYVTIGTADGYGGPLMIAVGATNPQGEIVGLAIAGHKETSAWMARVEDARLLESLVGKSYLDRFEVGSDIDGITGATYTSKAVAEATREGSQAAAQILGLPVTPAPSPRIQFGLPEMVLILLFAVGYIAHRRGYKYARQARWATMITGMVVLGFLYNQPLTLSAVNKFLLGYWPEWQANLYWYLLIGGMLFVFTVDNKNPYCQWFCPFGAAQECFGLVGGAKIHSAGKYHLFLKWVQRSLAWSAIFLALLLLNPGISSFEVFGAFFDLLGSNLQFLLLGIILLAAMFVKRPWCQYLCPLDPVMDLYRTFRIWVKESWQSIDAKGTSSF